MSYLGAIGYVMEGSGLEDLWSTAYASLSVKKMLSGHAFSRSIRAHILSFTAIAIIICKKIDTTAACKVFIQDFFNKWPSEPPLIGDCNADPVMKKLTEEFLCKIKLLENQSPTSKL